MLESGQVVKTVSGRDCTPAPKIECVTNRKTINSVKRMEAWMKENAIAEAVAQGNHFAKMQFEIINLKSISQSDKDCMHVFLFGTAN